VNALRRWVRLDLRRRARSLAVLAVLVALTTATVLTATAGARRGSTAVERLLEQTRPATIAVLPNEPGFDWDAVAAIPGVEALARFPLFTFVVEGVPDEAIDFAYADPEVMQSIERPVVLEGRLLDPEREDEVVVTAGFEGSYGKGVGDTLTLQLFAPEQVDANGLGISTEEPAGPRIEARIVGVVRSPWFGDDDGQHTPGRLVPSPALYAQHPESFIGEGDVISVNALVRLAGGGAAIPAFREQLAEVSGRQDIEFFDLVEMGEHVDEVAGFEADSLLAFAIAAAVAAVFLIGQSVARYAAGSTADLQVLRAFGMRPSHVQAGVAAGPLLAAIVGSVIGGAVSVALSDRFPMGTVEPFEPSPGRQVDLLVLVVGLVAMPLLVGGGALLAARRSVAQRDDRRGSAIAALAGRWGAPVPVLIGTRFALERGKGSQGVPVRPALLGAAVGVLGVVAALTFASGVTDASSNPARFGQVFEVESFLGFNGEDFVPTEEILELMAADPDVVAINDTRQSVAESGSVDLSVFSFDPIREPLDVVVTEGRFPASADEITLAPTSADDLGVRIGDTVELVGNAGDGRYTVSGIAFVPTGPHNDYDSGAWVGRATYDQLFDGFKFHTAELALREGADPDDVAGRLGLAVATALDDPSLASEAVTVLRPPSRLAELEQVRRLPLFLAAFLAVLAVGAVGHALATAVRRRRHDLAVLRALGVTRWQCRAMVVTQASILALFGLLVGVPVGMALGRTLWRTVAESTPVAYVTPMAVWLLILIGPVALLLANLLAAWPSQRAASIRVGHVLRAE
jgi:hypothetical protein